jgi:hypothetical protein
LGFGIGGFFALAACTDLWTDIGSGRDGSADGEGNGDGGLEDGELPEDPDAPIDLAAYVVSPQDFTTGAPGLSADFQGKIGCPNEERPCKGRWELSSGQKSDQLTLGPVTFSQPGFYRGGFTAIGRSDASVTAYVHVVTWNKTFSDDFNRATLDLHQHGWRMPSLDLQLEAAGLKPDASVSAFYAIEGNFLRVTGDTTAPGSSALLAYPKVANGKGQFKQRRTTPLNGDHYTDLVLRYDPTRPDGRFYRVRIHEYTEVGGLNRGEVVELAIFRIVRDDNQHGHLMNNRAPYWENPAIGDAGVPPYNDAGVQSAEVVGFLSPPGPIVDSPDDQCFASVGHPSGLAQYPPSDPGCPTAQQPAPGVQDAYRLEVTAQDKKITFKLYGYKLPAGPEKLILADAITDNSPDAITTPGLWGVAHFAGISYMDDFRLESYDP